MTFDTNVLTVVFTGLTALFTGMSALVGWQLYQHHKVDTGRKRPILLGKGKGLGSLVDHRQLSSHWLLAFEIHVYNQSAVFQRVKITDINILWPRGVEFELFDRSTSYDIAAHDGGDLQFPVTRSDILNELYQMRNDSEKLLELLQRGRRNYLARIKGETEGGHRFSYTGWLYLDLAQVL